MYYVAKLKKKEKLFQRAYCAEGGIVYITDTKKCKKRFLKSGMTNVIFGEEFYDEELFCDRLCEAREYDNKFCMAFIENMIDEIIVRLKLAAPVREIAVYSEAEEMIIEKLTAYTRLITIVGKDAEGDFADGVPVRRVKKLKGSPDIIILDNDANRLFDVPTIDLRELPKRGNKTLAWDRMSFKTDLFDFEINTPNLLYFLKKGEIKDFELTNLRKKCRRIFTFS